MAGDVDNGQGMSVKKPGFPGFLRDFFYRHLLFSSCFAHMVLLTQEDEDTGSRMIRFWENGKG